MGVRIVQATMAKLAALACLSFSIQFSTSPAYARNDAFTKCRPPEGAVRIMNFAEIPIELKPILKSIGEMADVGQAFNSIDVSDASSPPERRFIGGFMSRNRLVIWYEHGGRGLHDHAIGYLMGQNTRGVTLHMTANIVSAPCAATVAMFAGIQMAQDREV